MKDQINLPAKEEPSPSSGFKSQSRFLRFFKGMFSSCCSTAACSGTCCASSCGCPQEHKQMLLSDLKVGQHAKIVGVKTCRSCQFKLLDLGLSTGVDVTIRERALFGGPILVKARGSVLALRPSEASCITVSLIN